MTEAPFREAAFLHRPLRELGLAIADTRIQPIVEQLQRELRAAGLTHLEPRFYFSTEWGVPSGTVAIAIPFYLANAELAALHRARTGMVEGFEPHELIRYLRHELGHVINYAYRLFDDERWVTAFGAMSQPYVEEYRPRPFDARFVHHLPGWYAQKHPDEDWAETFAVWLTPHRDWRREYAHAPVALDKLRLCDQLLAEVRDRQPLLHDATLDEDIGSLAYSLDEFYRAGSYEAPRLPAGIDGSLRALFSVGGGAGATGQAAGERSGAELVARLEPLLATDIYRWTGYFPERARLLVRALHDRVAALGLAYDAAAEAELIVGLATLLTTLAMSQLTAPSATP